MKTPAKIGFGLIGISPFFFAAGLIGTFLYFVIRHGDSLTAWFLENQEIVALINLVLTGVMMLPDVIYLIHAAVNPHVSHKRTKWILLIVFLGAWVMPFYWYYYVWKIPDLNNTMELGQ